MKKIIPYLLILFSLMNCENVSYKSRLRTINLNDDGKNEAIFLNKEIGFKSHYSLNLYSQTERKGFRKIQKLMDLENYKPGDFLELSFENCNKDSLIDIMVRTKFENEPLKKYLIQNQSDLTKLKFGNPLELSVLPEPISYKNAEKINLCKF
ncbi:MAG: hypothetical protein KJ566_03035 [Nanoarchaeota archaeon]|nr:hypothetical protein [Nanoarchaeota archaeon]